MEMIDSKYELNKQTAKVKKALNCFWVIIGFTLVNLILLVLRVDFFFFFSAAIPNAVFTLFRGIDLENSFFTIIGLITALILLLPYAASYFFMKRYRFLILIALGYFAIDCVVLIITYVRALEEFQLFYLVDIVLHIWFICILISGARAAYHKTKKLVGGKRLNRSYGGDAFIISILVVFGLFFAFPLVFTINHAFKPMNEIFLFPPNIFVRNPTMNNFQDLFIIMSKSWVTFSRYIFNTVFITVVGTVGLIIVASMGAFVVSKYKFPGSKIFFHGVIITLMFSGYVTQIPNYLVMAQLGWVDTYLAIIVPAFAMPMGFFLLKQFIDTIPDTLLEAAKVDGAKEFRIFYYIILPMIKPAWLTVMIFSVQNLWNARASNFIYSEQLKTLPYALGQIITAGIARAGVGAAVTLFVMIVPLVMFILAQSNVLQTMANSGIKE